MADTCDSVPLFGGAVNISVPSLFQCKQPINPHMRRIVDRHQAFTEFENWPRQKIEADPTLIMADGGFYYLGDSGRVKCWYCNGGLKNWERYDDPWMEHAWFPLCEYLLKNKGVDFVKAVVKDFPGLNRPALSYPPPDKTLQGLQKLVKTKTPAERKLLFPPLMESKMDPRGGVDVKEEVEREILLGKNVEMAKLLGFKDQKIARVLTKQLGRIRKILLHFISLWKN